MNADTVLVLDYVRDQEKEEGKEGSLTQAGTSVSRPYLARWRLDGGVSLPVAGGARKY